MNIVKGVADLIRRTSSGHTGEPNSGPQVEKFSAPSPKIQFRYSKLVWLLFKNDCVLLYHCFVPDESSNSIHLADVFFY